jgi:hypothetical protein
MKSSFHGLIYFLPFILNHLTLPSPELDPFLLTNSDELSQLQTATDCFKVKFKVKVMFLETFRYIASGRTPWKISSPFVPYYFRRVY